MPSARSATSAARASSARASSARVSGARSSTARAREPARRPPSPRRVALRSPVTRARWERLGRIALLVVLLAVVVLYGEHALSYLSASRANDRQQATVNRLEREHSRLLSQQRSLRDPSTIIRDARALGMTRAGEQPYVVTGQSSR